MQEKPSAKHIEERLVALGDTEAALFAQRYFKTGPGQYGEGDRFLGIRMPQLRKLSRELRGVSLPTCAELLESPHHETRLLALLLLVDEYRRGDDATREKIFRLYLSLTHRINNWDLGDSSAPQIVGHHLAQRDRSILASLASSESLWERRIAILATLHFIRNGDFEYTFRIADILLADAQDLIHKAVGWMLREVGERDRSAEEAFLRGRYRGMPRTMLRYAIERFPEPLRQRYLKGEV